jgi:hypothetical protein
LVKRYFEFFFFGGKALNDFVRRDAFGLGAIERSLVSERAERDRAAKGDGYDQDECNP